MAQVWVLHNPLAGRPSNAAQVERAAEALARRGVSVHLERHATIDKLRQAAREAVAARAEAVLVAGGDGSLGTIAAELAGSPVALGCLPVGTANVWAREINLPTPAWYRPDAVARAALLLMDGSTRWVDLGRCNGRLFLLWAGLGLDAFVMHRLASSRWLTRQMGMPYQTAATFIVARDWHGAEARVAAASREATGHYLLVLVSNINWYGGGLFRLGARARLDDGQMDVWLFEGRTYGEALAHAGRMYVGRHVPHPQVTHWTADAVEIYPAAPQLVQTDGEPLASTEHVSIEVVPRTLRLLVPWAAPARLFTTD